MAGIIMFNVEETIRSQKSIRCCKANPKANSAAEEKELSGSFTSLSETGVTVPDHMKYLFSWLKER